MEEEKYFDQVVKDALKDLENCKTTYVFSR